MKFEKQNNGDTIMETLIEVREPCPEGCKRYGICYYKVDEWSYYVCPDCRTRFRTNGEYVEVEYGAVNEQLRLS